MINRNEKATATVTLDGKQSADEMNRLQAKAKDLTAQMRKLKDLNDKAGYDVLQKELKETNAEMKQLRINAVSVDAVMKNLSGASLKQLTAAQKQLNKEISETNRGTAEEKKQLQLKQQQLKLVNAEILKVKGNMSAAGVAQQSWLAGAAQGFNKYLGLITAAGAALAGFGFSFKSAIDSSNDFNQNLANLSSLTGLTGKDLDFLGDAAKQLSVTTTAEGIKITKSADDIVKAFTKVGGQRPELLANKDALMAVTREALILSEAAQIDLDQAILTVSASMNMFNLQGSEASRITNALAAGSKAGSAEVDYLGTAILKAGTSFQMAGISFEQSVGIVEAIAPSFTSAEQAGTNLQSFLLKLEAQTNGKFKPSIVGLNTALDNLAAANLSTAQIVKMFGLENSDIAPIMINNRDAIENYTKAVTGTNTAVEQAQITTNTYKAAQQQEENQIKLNAIALGDVLAPAQLKATKLFNGLISAAVTGVEWLKRNADTVIIFVKALGVAATAFATHIAMQKLSALWMATTRTATLALAAAKNLLSLNVGKAVQAFRLFAVSIGATPFGVIVTAVTAAVAAFALFRNETKKTMGFQKMINDASAKTIDNIAQETAKVKDLYDQLKLTNPKSKERAELIDKINNTYGTTLQNLSDEKAFVEQLDKSYNDLINTLTKKIIIESTAQTRVDLLKQQFLLEKDLLELEKKRGADNNQPTTAEIFLKGEIDRLKAALSNLDGVAKGIADKAGIDLNTADTTTGGGGGTAPLVNEDAQKAGLKILEESAKRVLETQDKLYRDTLSLRDKAIADVYAKDKEDYDRAVKYQNDVTDVGIEWGKVREQIELNQKEQISRINADHEKRLRDSLIAAKRDAGIARDEAYALDVAALDEKLAKEEISTDEYYLRMRTLLQKNIDEGLKLTEDALKKRNDILAKYGIAPGDTQQGEIAALEADALKDPTIFTTELVEKAKLKIIEKYAKMREDVESNTQNTIADKYKAGIAVAQDLVGGFGSYFQSAKDAELEAAGDNEEKKKNITKHYAGVELGIKIAQTLANMAMGIADVWAKYATNPVLAAIFSGLLVGNATAQIGLASAQREKIQGYEKGYYVQDQNGRPFNATMGGAPSTQMVSKPTVFLAGEQGQNFPEMIIDGPTFKRLQINYPDAITAINRSRTPGFATGSYPAQATTTTAQIPAELMAVISDLNSTLKKGINASLGWNEIKDKEYTTDLIEKSFGTLPNRLN